MLHPSSWQHTLLNTLTTALQSSESSADFLALLLTGSLADPAGRPDEWSDLDLVAIVADEALEPRFRDLAWLEPHGKILGIERYDRGENTKTLRLCFAPCRRLDLRLVSETGLREAPPLERPSHPHQLLWSKIPRQDAEWELLFPQHIYGGVPTQGVTAIVDGFYLKAAVALAKLVREDHLVATHLALDLARDCLVLQMMRRDRDLGTDVHRHGGFGNEIVQIIGDETGRLMTVEILNLIERCALLLDELAGDLLPSYSPKAEQFTPAIQQAAGAIAGKQ